MQEIYTKRNFSQRNQCLACHEAADKVDTKGEQYNERAQKRIDHIHAAKVFVNDEFAHHENEQHRYHYQRLVGGYVVVYFLDGVFYFKGVGWGEVIVRKEVTNQEAIEPVHFEQTCNNKNDYVKETPFVRSPGKTE